MMIKMTCQQFKGKCSLLRHFVISYIKVSDNTDWKEQQLTERFGLIEDGIEVSEVINWKKQRAATAGLGNVRVSAGYVKILKENKRFLYG
jgi:hypothetical protein